ncbi:GntR family transcriptional regulator [Cytobacillus sp. Sa5YUA1]|uniref:GntR family transcriptional regulator n=1 Tax=Cytobacillus stercorigallinarum TaxID=2762240 RepID=A0ABR8QVJ4_9BACI|nr:GntR family transcriptional regulator [Cytobacillus stercorigallinarum]MBD7939533.1 GntR family transcriptional regulator [Cytobacillus stercorigallinarum]
MRIVKPESLHQQAYHIIKSEILEGVYQPSERIVEAKAASKLGISRGPVREAIRMLIQDGLLVYNDGYVKVYTPTVQDVVDLFQCRESLEALAISLAIHNISEMEKEKLQENLVASYQANEKKDIIELGKLDQAFHDMIIYASKNKQLTELLEMIRAKIHYMRSNMVKENFYPTLVEEHEKIIDLLFSGDERGSQEYIRQHIKKGLDGVLMHIDKNASK